MYWYNPLYVEGSWMRTLCHLVSVSPTGTYDLLSHGLLTGLRVPDVNFSCGTGIKSKQKVVGYPITDRLLLHHWAYCAGFLVLLCTGSASDYDKATTKACLASSETMRATLELEGVSQIPT